MVKILEEAGYKQALLGLSLSYGNPKTDTVSVAKKLYNKDGGHSKFLESIVVWLDITATRGFWQHFDTYRVGTTKQSESTMHDGTKFAITQDDFLLPIPQETLDRLNHLVEIKDFDSLSNERPEGWLQRRIVCTNYKVLRNMVGQRKSHKKKEWKIFIEQLFEQLEHMEFMEDLK